GGKDNVTAVYVEGDQFATNGDRAEPWTIADGLASGVEHSQSGSAAEATRASGKSRRGTRRRVAAGLLMLVPLIGGYAAYRAGWRAARRSVCRARRPKAILRWSPTACRMPS